MHIPPSAFAQLQIRVLGAIEQAREQSRVLMDDHRSVRPLRRSDQPQSAAFFRLRKMLLLVARFDAEHARLHPDLKKMHGGPGRWVEFAMKHAGTCAHALNVARPNDRSISHGVLVRELALEHIADDFHVPMRMGPKPLACRHPVLVDHPQRPELHVLRVEIVPEREAVIRIEPPMIGMATICATSDVVHRTSYWQDKAWIADKKARFSDSTDPQSRKMRGRPRSK